MANNRREKSADAILDADTSLRVKQSGKQEALRSVEGHNFIKVSTTRFPNGRQKAEYIAR